MFELHFWGNGRNEKVYFKTEANGSLAAKVRRAERRRVREQVLRDLGMVKVRGALGGTYWE